MIEWVVSHFNYFAFSTPIFLLLSEMYYNKFCTGVYSKRDLFFGYSCLVGALVCVMMPFVVIFYPV